MSSAHILASSGGGAEALGFLLVIREARRSRREELGEIGRVERLWALIKETITNPAPAVTKLVFSADAGSGADAGVVTPTRQTTPIDALQWRITELEKRLANLQDQLSVQAGESRARLDAIHKEIADRLAEIERKRRGDLAKAIRNNRRGAWIFLLGVALTVASNFS